MVFLIFRRARLYLDGSEKNISRLRAFHVHTKILPYAKSFRTIVTYVSGYSFLV